MEEHEAWAALMDGMHDALAHALNGRIAGMDGVAQLARIRGGLDPELMGLLQDELKRLREVAESAVHLPRTERDLGPFTTLKDAVHGAVLVNRIRRNLVIVAEPSPDSAVVRARPDDVVRCLLLLIRSIEEREDAKASTVVSVVEAADGNDAVLTLKLATGPAVPDGAVIDAARAVAVRMGGAVQASEDGAVALRLPRLRET